MEQPFSFWMPLTKAGTDPQGRRWIEGLASDESVDLQGEVVVQKGLDLDYFVKHGFFNYDHQDVVAVKGSHGEERLAIGKIGEPTVVRTTPQGLHVKGFLYGGNPLADAVWELARSLEASEATRRLGFSIQGKTLGRDGNRITKAWIQDIAVTSAPVNPRTYLDVVKSTGASATEFARALSTGYARGEEAPVAEGAGDALRPESLEGRKRCPCCDEDEGELEKAIDEALAGVLDKVVLGRIGGAVKQAVLRLFGRKPAAPTAGDTAAPQERPAPPADTGIDTGPGNKADWRSYHIAGRSVPRSTPGGRAGGPPDEQGEPTAPMMGARRDGSSWISTNRRAALEDELSRGGELLTRDEAIRYVQFVKGYSRPTARLAVDLSRPSRTRRRPGSCSCRTERSAPRASRRPSSTSAGRCTRSG